MCVDQFRELFGEVDVSHFIVFIYFPSEFMILSKYYLLF